MVLRNRGNHITLTRVDWVQVPADLPLGEYVISFRWDTMDMQVWDTMGHMGHHGHAGLGLLRQPQDRTFNLPYTEII